MIVKLNLDSESLKRGLVQHFEKVLFGLVVLFCLLLVYRALAREGSLSWGPAELDADAQQAKTHVQEAHNRNTKMPVAKAFPVSLEKVQSGPYDDRKLLRPGSPLDRGLARRGMPKLFPVRDLQVAGGHGKFAMSSEEEMRAPTTGGDMGAGPMMGQFKGQRWVVLTAVIDYKKQRDAYQDAFQGTSYRSPNDRPEFAYFYVERGEVDPLNPSAEPTWVRLKTTEAMDVMLYWNASMPEVVDPMFIPPPTPDGIEFAFPLGPLQDRLWGPEVAHLPEIPLMETEMGAAEGQMAGSTMYPGMGRMYPGMAGVAGKRAAKKPSEKPGTEEVAVEEPPQSLSETAKIREAQRKAYEERLAAFKAAKANRPDAPSSPGTAGGFPGTSEPAAPMGYPGRTSRGPSGPGMMPMSGYGMGSMMGGMGRRGYSAPSRGMPTDDDSASASYGGARRSTMGYGMRSYGDAAGVEEVLEPDVLLFRYFDFKVEEGKQYRYRVQLVLANPNYGVNPQYLERDDLSAQPFLNNVPMSDRNRVVSDPSPVVTVPRDSQALVVSASAKAQSATLMLVHFNYADGEVSAEEVAQIQRGQLLNARNREVSSPAQPLMADTMMSPYGGARGTEEKRKVDYLTDLVFLDGAGGGNLPGKAGKDKTAAFEPSLALFLDPNGNLLVRCELDDKAEVDGYKPPEGMGRAGAWGGSDMAYPTYGPGYDMDDAGGGPYGKKGKRSSDKTGAKGRYPSGMGPGMTPYGSKGSPSGAPPGYPTRGGSGRTGPGMMPSMDDSDYPSGYPSGPGRKRNRGS